MRIGLPIEIAVRELYGKLWLALNLVQDGHEVVIGKDASIHHNIDVFKPDAMFMHGPFGIQSKGKLSNRYKNAGCSVIYLDTEGGIFSDDESYRTRIDPVVVESSDWIFAWGDRSTEIAQECSQSPERVLTTGAVRFDLLQNPLNSIYQGDSVQYSDKYGDYVLINTNFSIGNVEGGEALSSELSVEAIESPEDWHKFLCVEFIKAIHELSDHLPEINIIVRPHPSENHETYRREFSNSDTVYIRHTGSVRPWIKAARAVVHNGCTTGIEASLMQSPVIAYRPQRSKFETSLPNTVSWCVDDFDELVHALRLAKEPDLFRQQFTPSFEEVKEYIDNLNYYAVDRIREAIADINFEGYSGGFQPTIRERAKRTLVSSIGNRNITRIRKTGVRNHWTYSNRKYSYMNRQKLMNNLEKFSKFIDIDNVSVQSIDKIENGYLLKSTNNDTQ